MSSSTWLRRWWARLSLSRVPVVRNPKARPSIRPALEILEDRLAPAVLTVNTLADNTTDTAHLSLRDAIALVNNGGNGTSLGQSSLPAGWRSQISGTFGQGDTIQFDPGLLTQSAGYGYGVIGLTSAGDQSVGPSALAIDPGVNVTIAGPIGNSGITIERAPSMPPMRLFLVASTTNSHGSLTLENLTLADGDAQGGSGGFTTASGGPGGGAAGVGGAVFVNQGATLTIQDSTLTGNTAQGGEGGIYPTLNPFFQSKFGAGGGGLDGSGMRAQGLTPANGGGPNGGIGYGENHNGPGGTGGFGGGGGGGGVVYGTQVAGQPGGAGGWGGGGGGGGGGGNGSVNNGRYGLAGYGGGQGASANNQGAGGGGGGAGMGGAVYNYGGFVTITDSTFADNTAAGGLGGVNPPKSGGLRGPNGQNGAGLGGAIFNDNGTLAVISSTLDSNVADRGGAIFNVGHDAAAATVLLGDSILADTPNGNSDFWSTSFNGGTTPLAAVGENLIQNNHGFSVANSTYTVLTGQSPVLGPLQNNGGPTQTMAPLAGSPVLNQGAHTNLSGVSTDQRGLPRIYNLPGIANAPGGDGSDLGAVEINPAVITVNTASDNNSDPNSLSLRQAVKLADGILSRGTLSSAQQALVTGEPTFNATIEFAPRLAGQTIHLSSADDTTSGPSALLVSSHLTILGLTGSQGVTLAGPGASGNLRLFRVQSGASLTLENLTLEDGNAVGYQGGNANNAGGGGGGSAGIGGAILNQGNLTLVNSTLTGDTATGGAGGQSIPSFSAGGGGGGAGVPSSGGSSLAQSGGFGGPPLGGAGGSSNASPNGLGGGYFSGGGGGYGRYGFTGGQGGAGGLFGGGGGGGAGTTGGGGGAGGFGGGGGGGGNGFAGYYSRGSGGAGGYFGGRGGNNAVGGEGYAGGGGGGGAGLGGAIFNDQGQLTVLNSTFYADKAIGGAGGSGSYAGTAGQGVGGALFNYFGSVTVTNSTLSGNTAHRGGALFSDQSPLLIVPAVTLNNTILANSVGQVADYETNAPGDTYGSGGGNNLITHNAGFQGGIVSNANPLLSALGNFGGPTQTLSPLLGSPAIDTGNDAVLPIIAQAEGVSTANATDQTGNARLVGTHIDIGAVEYHPVPITQPNDPGFELPHVGSSYQTDPGGSPWTFTGASGVAGNKGPVTSGNPVAPQGTQVAWMQNGGTIRQSVTFTAGSYIIQFEAAQRGNYPSHSSIQVKIDGQTVGSITPTSTSYALYSTPSFTVTAGSHTIQLVGVSTSAGSTALLDAVSIQAAPVGVDIHGQPHNAEVGQSIGPVVVTVVDGNGNTVPGSDNAVTLSISSGPQGAVLEGRTTVRAVNGVATFTDLSLNEAGNYVLTASSGTLTPDFSNPFTITPADVSADVSIQRGKVHPAGHGQPHVLEQTLTLTNSGKGSLSGPLALVLSGLPGDVVLVNATGSYQGHPYLDVLPTDANLAAGQSLTVTLRFSWVGPGHRHGHHLSYSTDVLEGI